MFRSLPEVTIKRLEEMVTTVRDFEDLGQLEAWARKVGTITSVEELFAE